jgi:hypothetical protein
MFGLANVNQQHDLGDDMYHTVQDYENAVNRKPMTDEEIRVMIINMNKTNQMWSMRDFVRTVEEYHGIKNEG